jgi:IstB-like ATP binding protein
VRAHLRRTRLVGGQASGLPRPDVGILSADDRIQFGSLAEGGYIERAEPVLFIGEVAACRQKRRVRFTTAADLMNELVEAKHQLQLRRVLARWSRYDLIAIDETGNPQCAVVQSAARSHHGSGARSGNRDRIISLPPHGREAEENFGLLRGFAGTSSRG